MYEQFSLLLGRAYARLSELKGEKGQGITEYGIAVAFVVVALAGVLYALTPYVQTFIDNLGTDISNLPG
jgi:Flp pilus assembly pilin Flp